MDLASVAGAYEAIKAAKGLLTVAFDAKVDAEAKAKITEAQAKLGDIQDSLFSLREQLFALQEERNSLKQQLDSSAEWTKRLSAYTLTKTPGGAIVLQSNTEPIHQICPSCVNKHEMHILQTNRTLSGKYRCTGCGSEFPVEPRENPPAFTPEPIQTPWR